MPPLTALRVFEAAARHLSFKKAADELNVTPAAVSHQITLLEDFLGIRLFERLHRAISLTPAAEASLTSLSAGFEAIRRAVDTFGTSAHVPLTVSCPPTFAYRWLMPRLHLFVSLYPEIDVQVTTQLDLVREARRRSPHAIDRIVELAETYDIVIGFGRVESCPLVVRKLIALDITPLCSPSLVAKHSVTVVSDIVGLPILHDGRAQLYGDEDFWTTWLTAAGATRGLADGGRRFTHSFLALDAAADNGGIVVSTPALAADDLSAGRLIMPFGLRVPIAQSYYFALQEAKVNDDQIRPFIEWLTSEAAVAPTMARHDVNDGGDLLGA